MAYSFSWIDRRELCVLCHTKERAFLISLLFSELHRLTKGGTEALKNIESCINSKLIKETQYDQHKICSVFEGQQDGSKQQFVAFIVYDSAI